MNIMAEHTIKDLQTGVIYRNGQWRQGTHTPSTTADDWNTFTGVWIFNQERFSWRYLRDNEYEFVK